MKAPAHNPQIQAADLGILRLLWILAVLAVLFVVALALAPLRHHHTPWRTAQERYNREAARLAVAPTDVGVKQIWRPELGVVDRCTSCHVGMGAGEPLGAAALAPAVERGVAPAASPAAPDPRRLHAGHPPLPHEPKELGCTICHAGQGRATTIAAHGHVQFWEEPLLERAHFQAGCGSCHTHLRAPSAQSRRGQAHVEQGACRDCHRLDGVGRGEGPDLSHVGLKGFDPEWHARHLERRAESVARAAAGRPAPVPTGPAATPAAVAAARALEQAWRQSFAALPPPALGAVDEYLRTLAGAPRLQAGKGLAHRLGCRGCHKINGVGGDEGPDLSAEGRKAIADLDFKHVRGPRTLASWLHEHFLEPGRVVGNSQMPNPGVSAEQADLLTTYALSLRPRPVPEALTPKDRVRGLRLGERDFAGDGESLFATFCSGCHGPRGEGRRPGADKQRFPAVANPDFLRLADDGFLRRTITEGRPGRRMPSWGAKEGGLRPAEITALVGYLRSLAPTDPTPTVLFPSGGDAARGAPLYARHCAGCHGPRGEGREGPALGNPGFQATASDDFIAATVLRGRTGTPMPRFEVAGADHAALSEREIVDLVAFVRSFAPSAPRPAAAPPGK